MGKRLVFTIVAILCLPLQGISVVISLFIMIPISILYWIITGDPEDKTIDIMFSPMDWAAKLPYKITGADD